MASEPSTNMALPKYLYCLNFFYALAALTLAFVGTSCHFLQFTSSETINDLDSGESKHVSLHFGLWYYQKWNITNSSVIEESCDIYPSSISMDGSWKAARTFNLIAVILGGSLILLDIFDGCLSTKRNKSFRLGVIGYSICCIASGLSLLMLDSSVCKDNVLIEKLNQMIPMAQFQETCSIAKGAKSTIAATVLWAVAAISAAILHPLHKKGEDQNNTMDNGLDEPLLNDDINVL